LYWTLANQTPYIIHPPNPYAENFRAMKVNEIVTDPSLQPVLRTSAETLAQCHKLLSLLEPTSSSSPPSQETLLEISKQQKFLFALLARLRGLNRDAILGVRATKQATAEARQEIDRLHLHLQNLYYEQRHLNGEIAACESYEYVFSSSLLSQSKTPSAFLYIIANSTTTLMKCQ
jgi:hypothetical protein